MPCSQVFKIKTKIEKIENYYVKKLLFDISVY